MVARRARQRELDVGLRVGLPPYRSLDRLDDVAGQLDSSATVAARRGRRATHRRSSSARAAVVDRGARDRRAGRRSSAAGTRRWYPSTSQAIASAAGAAVDADVVDMPKVELDRSPHAGQSAHAHARGRTARSRRVEQRGVALADGSSASSAPSAAGQLADRASSATAAPAPARRRPLPRVEQLRRRAVA